MLSIYFAGDLFDHKHLAGNELLAQHIQQQSSNRYWCDLPQQFTPSQDAHEGRNKCLEAIVRADIALFNFDGPDVDSGTMVEFIVAKMLDIPTVIVRTDFRNGAYWGDNYNFMAAFFPRCITVTYPCLMPYKTIGITGLHIELADLIIKALDEVTTQPSILNTPEAIMTAYKHVIAMCGDNLATLLDKQLKAIIQQKMIKKLYLINQKEAVCTTYL